MMLALSLEQIVSKSSYLKQILIEHDRNVNSGLEGFVLSYDDRSYNIRKNS